MTRIQCLDRLFEISLPYVETILLRSEWGTSELKGKDLVHKGGEHWLTVYHDRSPSRESMSHLHVKKGALEYITLVEPENRTPQLQLWGAEGPNDGKPPISLVFAPFYDWLHGGLPLKQNQERYFYWLNEFGGRLELT